jgi:signal transduction histidine kinase
MPNEGRAVDIRSPAREAAELAHPEILSRGGTLELRIADEPLVVVADAAQVKRAVLNLLRNAFQAGDRVLLEVFRHGTEVGVAVTDNGPGIAPDLRSRIFEPFVTDKEQGAGLGLAIVQKVVEAQGGRVTTEEPEPGAGSGSGARFVLYFTGLEEPPSTFRAAGTEDAEAPGFHLTTGSPNT